MSARQAGPSPLTRAEFISCVAARLGYPGAVPNALYARIEALQLGGFSVLEAVARLRREWAAP